MVLHSSQVIDVVIFQIFLIFWDYHKTGLWVEFNRSPGEVTDYCIDHILGNNQDKVAVSNIDCHLDYNPDIRGNIRAECNHFSLEIFDSIRQVASGFF